ncbi:MAG: PilZ domain-containing protein [Spirochaetaceae bacterium]
MLEKRKYQRFPVICKAECTSAEMLVLNMSREGMNIETSYYFKNKDDISFTLIFPSFDIIKITSDIIWEKKDENDKFNYGIKINKLSSEHEKVYLSFINELDI